MMNMDEERRDAHAARLDEGMSEEVNQASGAADEGAIATKSDSRMRPKTVRFTAAGWSAIHDVAAENGISDSELVRMAIAGNIASYLGTIRFIDTEQGEEIKAIIQEIKDSIRSLKKTESGILNELNRIGVNYNQNIRLWQIETKQKNNKDVAKLLQLSAEKKKIEAECRGFSKDDLDSLMRVHKETANLISETLEKVGETLCRILV